MRFTVASRAGNMFSSNLSKECDCHSLMTQGRSVGLVAGGRGMTGGGFFDTLRSLFSRGKKMYEQAKPYAEKAQAAYKKYKPVAERAYSKYKSDEVQQYVPESIKKKERAAATFAKDKYKAAEDLYKDTRKFGESVQQGYQDVVGEPIGKTWKGVKQKLENPADGLKASLMKQDGSGLYPPGFSQGSGMKHHKKHGRGLNPPGLTGSGHCGSGLNPPGLIGSGGYGDLIKLAGKLLPAVINQIQQGQGLSNKQAQSLLKASLIKARPILSGVTTPQTGQGFADTFKKIASALVTPINLVTNIMDRANGQSGSGAKKNQKVINKMKKHIAMILARSATRKQSGRGASFSDVMSGIGDTISHFMPLLSFL